MKLTSTCRSALLARVAVPVIAVLLTGVAHAQEAPPVATAEKADSAATATQNSADPGTILREVAPSMVVTKWTLRQDGADAPSSSSWATRCPSCGEYHGGNSSPLEEERPAEVPGFLVGADRVIVSDSLVHPRFVEKIEVTVGDQTRQATVSRVFTDRLAIELKLDEPVDAKPLEFNGDNHPFYAASMADRMGDWTASMSPLGSTITLAGDEVRRYNVDSAALLLDKDGKPVSLTFAQGIGGPDDSVDSPDTWNAVDIDEYNAKLEALDEMTKQALPRVHLSFRSPPKGEEDSFSARMYGGYGGPDDESDKTERDVVGLAVSEHVLLIPIALDAKTTARLRSITVHLPDGSDVEAKFVASLKDYEAMIVRTESPLPRAVEMSDADPHDLLDEMLPTALLEQRGESREIQTGRARIIDLNPGWRRQLAPSALGTGDEEQSFLFDDDLRLVALPLDRRELTDENNYYFSSMSSDLRLASYLDAVLADPAAHADPTNVPLTAEEESRIAWLGAEVQPLTPELARFNDVADETNDGATGALVSFVYPDSPAAEMGIEPGSILLRLHVPDRPRPISIEATENFYAEMEFPWQQLSELPEMYFSQIPRPWTDARDGVNKTLTDVGIGQNVELEFVADGEVKRVAFDIQQSPPHYDSAKRVEDEATGLTLQPLTFEVRRYFQLDDDAPGLMIHDIEPGSIASKAGLKPREFITHADNEPLKTTQDFLDAIAAGGSVKLQVTRFNEGRIVQLKVEPTGETDEIDEIKEQPIEDATEEQVEARENQ